jgi:hypothetical protein
VQAAAKKEPAKKETKKEETKKEAAKKETKKEAAKEAAKAPAAPAQERSDSPEYFRVKINTEGNQSPNLVTVALVASDA